MVQLYGGISRDNTYELLDFLGGLKSWVGCNCSQFSFV